MKNEYLKHFAQYLSNAKHLKNKLLKEKDKR